MERLHITACLQIRWPNHELRIFRKIIKYKWIYRHRYVRVGGHLPWYDYPRFFCWCTTVWWKCKRFIIHFSGLGGLCCRRSCRKLTRLLGRVCSASSLSTNFMVDWWVGRMNGKRCVSHICRRVSARARRRAWLRHSWRIPAPISKMG